MRNTLLGRKSRGATALTYGLVVGLVAIAGLSAVTRVGESVEGLFIDVASSIDGSDTAGDGPVNAALPSISGTLQVGQTLTADVGTWSGTPSYTIAWVRNGSTEVGTGSTYLVDPADAGQTLVVRVTASTDKGSSTAVSAAVTIETTLFSFTSHTFTTCGQSGRTGPSLSNCRSAYSSAPWASSSSNFTVSSGIQAFTIPQTGTYRITVAGARGGRNQSYSGGRGAVIRGDFSFIQGDTINILVGQQGTDDTGENCDTGSGGGTFVVEGSTALIVAGGGGGASYNTSGKDGLYGTSGGRGDNSGGQGGTNGNGGAAASSGSDGGGGFLSNGGINSSSYGDTAGRGYQQGGTGGATASDSGANGGFGGGAGGHGDCYIGSGGAGGYSGGGAGGYNGDLRGGGGGSYNSGANATNVGYNTGHGYVTIELQ